MKRRLISLNLVLVLLCSMLPAASASGNNGYAIFYKNDGSWTAESSLIDQFASTNCDLMLYYPAPEFTQTDKVVTSYNSKEDGTGTVYGLTSAVSEVYSVNSDSPAKLYAQWEDAPGNYTLYVGYNEPWGQDYLTQDGKDYVLKTNQGSTATILSGDIFDNGSSYWKVVGWDSEKYHNVYSDGSLDYLPGDVVTQNDLTLYAVLGVNAIRFWYSASAGAQELTATIQRYTGTNQTVGTLAPDPVAENALFVGWNTKADGSGQWCAENELAANAPSQLYAIFEEYPDGYYCVVNAAPYALPDGPMRKIIPMSAQTEAVTMPGEADDFWSIGTPDNASGFVHQQQDICAGGQSLTVTSGDWIQALQNIGLLVTYYENYPGFEEVMAYYQLSFYNTSVYIPGSAENFFSAVPSNAVFKGWNTKADGSGYPTPLATTGDIQLYAQWLRTVPEVTITLNDSGKPYLTWNQVDGADQYQVYRSTTGEAGTFTKIYTTTGTRLTNSSAAAGTTYYYKVRAVVDGEVKSFGQTVKITTELGTPTLTLTLNDSGKPYMTWTAVSGADKYQVYRSTSGKTGTFTRIYTTTGTRLTNSSAAAGTTYYYKVRALTDDVTGSFSAAKSVTTTTATPELTITLNSSGKPYLTWTSVSQAEKYQVYRSTTGEVGTFTKVYTTTGNRLTNTSAAAGTTYYYKVRAVVDGKVKAFGEAVTITTTLGVPTLTLTLNDSGKPYLTWTAVSGADKYQVYRSTSGKDGTFARIYTTTGTRLTNTSAAEGTTYYYMVRALTDDVTGSFSTAKSVTTTTATPNLTVTLNDSGKPYLTWTSVNQAEKYQVYRSTTGETGTFTRIYTTTGNRLTNTSAVDGTTYYYKVRAVVDGAVKAFGNTVEITAGVDGLL